MVLYGVYIGYGIKIKYYHLAKILKDNFGFTFNHELPENTSDEENFDADDLYCDFFNEFMDSANKFCKKEKFTIYSCDVELMVITHCSCCSYNNKDSLEIAFGAFAHCMRTKAM